MLRAIGCAVIVVLAIGLLMLTGLLKMIF